MTLAEKDQLNAIAAHMRKDMGNVLDRVQTILNEEVKIGNYISGKIEVTPCTKELDECQYLFKVSVGPSFPVNVKEFIYNYGVMKIMEISILTSGE
jgi:hypothetical protein